VYTNILCSHCLNFHWTTANKYTWNNCDRKHGFAVKSVPTWQSAWTNSYKGSNCAQEKLLGHQSTHWRELHQKLTSHTDTIRFHLKNNTTPSYNSKEKTQNKSKTSARFRLFSEPCALTTRGWQQTQNATTINNRIHVKSYVQQHPRNSRRVFQSTFPWNQLNYKHPRTFTINTVKQASRFTMYRVMGHMQTGTSWSIWNDTPSYGALIIKYRCTPWSVMFLLCFHLGHFTTALMILFSWPRP